MIIDIVYDKTQTKQEIEKATIEYWGIEQSSLFKSSYLVNSLLLTIYPCTIHIATFDESENSIRLIIDYVKALFKNMMIAISCTTHIESFMKIDSVCVIDITPHNLALEVN